MINDYIEKLRLCITEMQICREIIKHSDKVDDWCGHLFGIYIAIRMDDFTKIAGKSIPKDSENRTYFDDMLNQYNQEFRIVRDKIGSHFQHVPSTKDKDSDDMFRRIEIYTSFNFKEVVALVENASVLFEMICDVEGVSKSHFTISPHDLNLILDYCNSVYMDDVAHLGVDAFAIGGKNTGFALSCTATQRKAQLIKSLELMADNAVRLAELAFIEAEPRQLFQRLFVCIVVNFYDNIITRSISQDANQYDEGFDKMIGNLSTKDQPVELLEGFFEQFHQQYCMTQKIERLRDIRDRACGHLDLTLSLAEINDMLDTFGIEQQKEIYKDIRNFWEFLVNNVFLLTLVSIPARSPLYESRFESIERPKHFYDTKLDDKEQPTLSIADLWRFVIKDKPEANMAFDKLSSYLKEPKKKDFLYITSFLTKRLTSKNISVYEAHQIKRLVMSASRAFPDEILEFLIDAYVLARLHLPHAQYTLLYLLAYYADNDTQGLMEKIINEQLGSKFYCVKALGLLMRLHYEYRLCNVRFKNKNADMSTEFKRVVGTEKNAIERAAMMICLGSNWFSSEAYSCCKMLLPKFTDSIIQEVRSSVIDYLKYIDAKDLNDECNTLISCHRFTQLNYLLGEVESKRKQKKNPFRINNLMNLVWPVQVDKYEQVFHALSLEAIGEKELALACMSDVAQRNPLDEKIKLINEDLKKRIGN